MFNKKGEIATLLTLGLVILGGVLAIGSSIFLSKQKTTTNTKAAFTCPVTSGKKVTGQTCDSLNKCDVDGGCNPACCKDNSDCHDNQTCTIPNNGYCQTTTSCDSKSGTTSSGGGGAPAPASPVSLPTPSSDGCFRLTAEIYSDDKKTFNFHIKFWKINGGSHLRLKRDGEWTPFYSVPDKDPFDVDPIYAGQNLPSKTYTFEGSGDSCPTGPNGMGTASLTCMVSGDGTTASVSGQGCEAKNFTNTTPVTTPAPTKVPSTLTTPAVGTCKLLVSVRSDVEALKNLKVNVYKANSDNLIETSTTNSIGFAEFKNDYSKGPYTISAISTDPKYNAAAILFNVIPPNNCYVGINLTTVGSSETTCKLGVQAIKDKKGLKDVSVYVYKANTLIEKSNTDVTGNARFVNDFSKGLLTITAVDPDHNSLSKTYEVIPPSLCSVQFDFSAGSGPSTATPTPTPTPFIFNKNCVTVDCPNPNQAVTLGSKCTATNGSICTVISYYSDKSCNDILSNQSGINSYCEYKDRLLTANIKLNIKTPITDMNPEDNPQFTFERKLNARPLASKLVNVSDIENSLTLTALTNYGPNEYFAQFCYWQSGFNIMHKCFASQTLPYQSGKNPTFDFTIEVK